MNETDHSTVQNQDHQSENQIQQIVKFYLLLALQIPSVFCMGFM